MVKNPPANAGDIRGVGSIPGSGRSPGGRNGNPLQYSSLENPVDRGAWQATAHGVAKSRTRLKRLGKQSHLWITPGRQLSLAGFSLFSPGAVKCSSDISIKKTGTDPEENNQASGSHKPAKPPTSLPGPLPWGPGLSAAVNIKLRQ